MKKRIISAIIMAIIFIPLLIIGNLPFTVCISILSMASIYELLKLKPNLPLIIKIFTYLETLIIVLFNTLKLNGNENTLLMLLLVINLSLIASTILPKSVTILLQRCFLFNRNYFIYWYFF